MKTDFVYFLKKDLENMLNLKKKFFQYDVWYGTSEQRLTLGSPYLLIS